MSLNWTLMAYIGFGDNGDSNVIINTNGGLVPIQEVNFYLEEVVAEIDIDLSNVITIYNVENDFTLFLDEEGN